MEIKAAGWKSWKGQGQTLAVFAFQDETPALLGLGKEAKILAALARSDGFKGRERETFITRPTDNLPSERLVLVECGAGTAIPSVRRTFEALARHFRATHIRINPREPQGPPGTLSIPLGALAGLSAIDAALAGSDVT